MQSQATAQDTSKEAPRTPALRARYEIDPAHASAQFRVRHLMVSYVRGELGPVSGYALIDADDMKRSEVFASIDATGISTRDAGRDEHLRSADFLDVARHPTVTFRSTEIVSGTDGRLEVVGELTIRGTTRRVPLEVELSDEIRDPWGNAKRGVSAAGRVSRRDFDVNWNAAMEAGGLVVGDTVEITLDLELVRKSE